MELKEVMAEIDKPKISIVMQSYLGSYPGSRQDSQSKFKRAVDSFKNQLYKNCELIIVADDCTITKAIYDREYTHDANIRLVYVSRLPNERSTYTKNDEGHKYFRGYPRRLGVAAATGSLITYMDSDDLLLEEFTLHLLLEYNRKPEATWFINRSWYDNSVMIFKDSENMNDTTAEPIELPDVPEKWNVSTVRDGKVVMSPWLLMHKPVCDILWRDTWGSISEDADFNSRLRQQYKAGHVMNRPTYVRCHFTNKWDV